MLHVNTSIFEAKSDKSTVDGRITITSRPSFFLLQVQLSALVAKHLFLFDELIPEELGQEEAKDPKSYLEAIDYQDLEVLIGETSIPALVEAVRVLFQGCKDNQRFQVEQEVHRGGHLVLEINWLRMDDDCDYSFQVLLVLVFGSVEPDDGPEKAEEAANVV